MGINLDEKRKIEKMQYVLCYCMHTEHILYGLCMVWDRIRRSYNIIIVVFSLLNLFVAINICMCI